MEISPKDIYMTNRDIRTPIDPASDFWNYAEFAELNKNKSPVFIFGIVRYI